ncbi:hypothetical protein F1C16_11015 [Hymenobacter sp. NBH84]|nr:hypothetical protein F1C16_11015 [Hymenobacter sp. NBH84]
MVVKVSSDGLRRNSTFKTASQALELLVRSLPTRAYYHPTLPGFRLWQRSIQTRKPGSLRHQESSEGRVM